MTLGENFEYLIAWLIYLGAGVGFAFVWWQVTENWRNTGWRELSRGFCIVFVFTPWHAGEQAGYYAPAIVVLAMDVLLGGVGGGLEGGIVLLASSFVMLLILIIRQFVRR